MKKIIIAVAVLFSAASLTSCSKDYKCVCKLNDNVVYTKTYDDVTRAEAEDKCDGDGSTLGGSVQWDCDVDL